LSLQFIPDLLIFTCPIKAFSVSGNPRNFINEIRSATCHSSSGSDKTMPCLKNQKINHQYFIIIRPTTIFTAVNIHICSDRLEFLPINLSLNFSTSSYTLIHTNCVNDFITTYLCKKGI